MDFIINLPVSSSYNAIFTVIDKLKKFTSLIPYFIDEGALSAVEVEYLCFTNIVCLFGLLRLVLHDRGPRLTVYTW